MEATQLLLKINKPGFNNEWNEKITCLLKGLANLDDIQVIEANESNEVQLNINYDVTKVPFNKISELVQNTGAAIIEINMHLTKNIRNVKDPFGKSVTGTAFSVGELSKVEGLSGIAVSSKGNIKVTLDPAFTNKQAILETILNKISTISSGNN